MIHFKRDLRPEYFTRESKSGTGRWQRSRSIAISSGNRGASVCLSRKGIIAHLMTHFAYSESKGELLTLPELLALEAR